MDSSNPTFLLFTALFLLASPLFNDIFPSKTLAQLLPIVRTNCTQVFIVHVQRPKGSDGLLTSEELNEWYFSYLPNTTLDSGEPRMIHTYAYVISGFAARLTAEEATSLESMDGFVFAYPEKIQPLHTTYTPEFLGLNQFNGLWEHSSQGEGVIVAVLDSGITPNHPSFADTLKLPPPPLKWRRRCHLPAGSGSCNNKLVGVQNFIVPVPGRSNTPIDTTGHGTHVAGIATGSPVYNVNVSGLANGTASGMAPSAHLAVYKVCPGNGCPDSFSLKGIEKAIWDGVDIIQISNGAPSEFYLSGNTKGSFRAMQKGVLTICAAGNSGPSPSIIANDAPWILTVGAATTDRRNTAVLKLGNGMVFNGESSYQPHPSGIVNVSLIYPGVVATQVNLACQNGSMAGLNVTGKLVICGRGYNDPVEKSKVVKEAGGAGIILLNLVRDGDTLSSYSFVIPGIHVAHNDALKIIAYFTAGTNPTASITFKGTEFGVPPSPSVAAFSSRGPSLYNGGILKPDVVAPGVDILSAWPFDAGDGSAKSDAFDFKSGTSMAAPHVSGIAALLKKVHPDWSPAMIKSAIMTTAYTEDRNKNRITDDGSNSRAPANAFAIGAGHVNPSAAEDPGLVYDTGDEDYIAYLCGLKGMSAQKIVIITNMPSECSKKKKIAVEELNYPSIQVSMGSGVKNKTVPRTVKNVGKANSIYTVTVIEPKGVTVDVNPKKLQFASVGEEKNFTVDISLTGSPPAGGNDVWEGRLTWVSGKYQVTSPIVIIE